MRFKFKHIRLLAADRNRLNQLETFSGIRPIVFQQQQLEKALLLNRRFNTKQQQFTAVSSQFEQEKRLIREAETALQQFQSFEQNHQHELTQVRKYVQEREYIADEYKKTKLRLKKPKTKRNNNHYLSSNSSLNKVTIAYRHNNKAALINCNKAHNSPL